MNIYQCNTCSSHSYNPNSTSGPLGPRQIGNYVATIAATGPGREGGQGWTRFNTAESALVPPLILP